MWRAVEATGLGFICYVIFNPLVLLANRVDFGLLFYIFLHKLSNFITFFADILHRNFPIFLLLTPRYDPVFYDGAHHRWADYPLADVLRIIGRAGRPGRDTEALWGGAMGIIVFAGEAHRKLCAQSFKANDWVY